jgi:hypothetical protein
MIDSIRTYRAGKKTKKEINNNNITVREMKKKVFVSCHQMISIS